MSDLPVPPPSSDTQEVIHAMTGTYEDPVAKLSQNDTILLTPKGAEPSPFRNMRDAGGGRG